MRLNALICGLICLAAAACGKKTEPAPEVEASEAAAPAGPVFLAPATPLAEIDCAVDRLPVTGACPNADPRQFLKIDEQRPLFRPRCVWATREVQTAVDEAVIFRAQDCSGEGWDVGAYAWADADYGGEILTGPRPDNALRPILEVHRLTAGLTLQTVAMETLGTAPENERGQCRLTPLDSTSVPGKAFLLGPDEALMTQLQLQHAGDVFEACGSYGLNDSAQMWEQRRTRAFFHFLGQDDSEWDEASFTFYKQAGGVWIRDE